MGSVRTQAVAISTRVTEKTTLAEALNEHFSRYLAADELQLHEVAGAQFPVEGPILDFRSASQPGEVQPELEGALVDDHVEQPGHVSGPVRLAASQRSTSSGTATSNPVSARTSQSGSQPSRAAASS